MFDTFLCATDDTTTDDDNHHHHPDTDDDDRQLTTTTVQGYSGLRGLKRGAAEYPEGGGKEKEVGCRCRKEGRKSLEEEVVLLYSRKTMNDTTDNSNCERQPRKQEERKKLFQSPRHVTLSSFDEE